MTKKAITFYSEGFRLVGDVFYPDGLQQSDTRAGIVLCHGYTGVKDLYLPDNARVLTEAGYVVLTFDYKGWGDSEGPRSRLAPYSRVADVQAALTYLGSLPEVDPARLGIYGTSYGGATVVWTAAIDPRVKCVVSVVGIGNGTRWMRSVRRPDEFHDLLARADQDRLRQTVEGKSEFVKREEILLPDRQSAELNPEWVVDRIAPRPVLFITTDDDRLVPPEESVALHARAGEPKKLVILKGYGHYEVYLQPAFSEVMRETTAWFQQHLPAVH